MTSRDGLELNRLRQAVQHNCDVSDAEFAQSYSLCTYLLKMRELYRWENGLPFSVQLDREAVGEWVSHRESRWDAVEEDSLTPIPVCDSQLQPYAQARINAHLADAGLVYAGGQGRRGQPVFFLGERLREERFEDFDILVAGKELARDLSAPPAMMREGLIIIRQASIARTLFEAFDEWRWRPGAGAMARLANYYRLHDALDPGLARAAAEQVDVIIAHEVGEGVAARQLEPAYSRRLTEHLGRPMEQAARAIRDLLADCLVTLPRLIEAKTPHKLDFYFANFRGLRRQLFPSLLSGYERWCDAGDLSALDDAMTRGKEHWSRAAENVFDFVHDRESGLSFEQALANAFAV